MNPTQPVKPSTFDDPLHKTQTIFLKSDFSKVTTPLYVHFNQQPKLGRVQSKLVLESRKRPVQRSFSEIPCNYSSVPIQTIRAS